MEYDYCELHADVKIISKKYPFIKIKTIGKSAKGRDIYAFRIGTGEKEVFYNGAHHGLESITAKLLVRFIYDFAFAYVYGIRLQGYDVRKIYDNVSIYIVPMVNPDGIERAKKDNTWQANANGVDINHNYNALWHEGKEVIAKEGITKPGSTKYSGPYPESEPETRAIVNFTCSHNFDYVIAFHSQGEVIYWKFGNSIPKGSYNLARLLSDVSGYALDNTEGTASYSGYKDWFICKFDKPGFTVEVGLGKNPLPDEQFEKIYGDILEMLLVVSV